MLRVSVSAPGRAMRWRFNFGDAGEDYRLSVWKLRDEGEIAAHRLDRFSQGGKQKVAALFEARNAILGDAEFPGHADLRQLAGAP